MSTRITKDQLSFVQEVLDKYAKVELVYMKAEKNDRTDLTFMVYDVTRAELDEIVLFMKNRFCPFSIQAYKMMWPDDVASWKVELIDVDHKE